MNILWVENNPAFVEVVLKSFLTAHIVLVVPSLAEARQALTAGAFDAVLLDYDLDDGKGTELVSRIKELNTPPFIVAASSHAEGNAKLIQAGADVVCSKMQFAQADDVLMSIRGRAKSEQSEI